MADFLLTWGIAPSANNGYIAVEYREYGTSTWLQYGGVLTPGTTSGFVYGLDDNTVYEFRIVNNCFSGDESPSNVIEQYVVECPTFKQLTSDFCGIIDYDIQEIGGDITTYIVTLYEVGNPTPVDSAIFTATGDPGDSVSGQFTNLYPGKTYQAQITFVIQGATAYTIKTCPKQSVTVSLPPTCDPITTLVAAFGEGIFPTLELTWTEPIPAPSNGYKVYWRILGSSGAYSEQDLSAGETGITISGILANTDYEGYVVAVCDPCCTHPSPLCNNYSVQVPFETNAYNVIIGNSYYNTLTITGASAGIGFSYSGTGVEYGEVHKGYHDPFSHTIDITVGGDSTVSGAGYINILVNGIVVDCVDIPAGDYSVSEFFISSNIITVGATDILTLSFENGECEPLALPTMLTGIAVGTALTGIIGNICLGTVTETIYLLPSYVDITTGCIAYTDSLLSTPLTGYNYINDSTGVVYNINPSTGLVGTVSGIQCI